MVCTTLAGLIANHSVGAQETASKSSVLPEHRQTVKSRQVTPRQSFLSNLEFSRPIDPDERPGKRFFSWRQAYKAGLEAAERDDLEAAGRLFQSALELARAVNPSDERVTASEYQLGRTLRCQGHIESAKSFLSSAVNSGTKNLWALHPTVLAAQSELAALYEEQNNSDRAMEAYDQQFASMNAIEVPPAIQAWIENMRIAHYLNLQNFNKVEPQLEQLLKNERVCLDSKSKALAFILVRAARLYEQNERLSRAAQLLLEAKEIFETSTAKCNEQTLMCLGLLRLVYVKDENWDKARSNAQEALKAAAQLGKDKTPFLRCLADVYHSQGKATGDRVALDKAESIYKQILAQDSKLDEEAKAEFLHLLGEVFLLKDEFAPAEQTYAKSAAIRLRLPDHEIKIADMWEPMGNLFAQKRRREEAIKAYKLAAAALQGVSGQDERKANLWYSIGNNYCWMKDFSQAELCYKTALSLLLNAPEMHRKLLVSVLNQWGHINRAQKKIDTALQLVGKALSEAQKAYSADDRSLIQYLVHYALVLEDVKRYDESAIYFERALAIAEKSGDSPIKPVSEFGRSYLSMLSQLHRDDQLKRVQARISRFEKHPQ